MWQTLRAAYGAAVLTFLMWLAAGSASAQTFDGAGTRAQGMGAFVAIADDASAVYWNPAGLASGAYFSLLIDRTDAEVSPSGETRGGSRSSWLLALSAPVVGLSYYRLRFTTVAPEATVPSLSRVESLVTHHAGATLVQSLSDQVAVGGTVKLVRGIANTFAASGTAEELLDDAELMGVASNRFDFDVGIMATTGLVRAGLTLRNLTEPEFRTPTDGIDLRLDRQARAGVALLLTRRWTAAVDVDLTSNRGPVGDVRTLAVGAEGWLTRRATARGGVQINTAGGERAPLATLGGSYAAFGSLLIDAHFSTGSDHAFGGWGVAGRVVF